MGFEVIKVVTPLAARWFLSGLIFTLKMEAMRYFETSVHIRTTRRYIPEDRNIQNTNIFTKKYENIKYPYNLPVPQIIYEYIHIKKEVSLPHPTTLTSRSSTLLSIKYFFPSVS
jgi:hypothetical protein